MEIYAMNNNEYKSLFSTSNFISKVSSNTYSQQLIVTSRKIIQCESYNVTDNEFPQLSQYFLESLVPLEGFDLRDGRGKSMSKKLRVLLGTFQLQMVIFLPLPLYCMQPICYLFHLVSIQFMRQALFSSQNGFPSCRNL